MVHPAGYVGPEAFAAGRTVTGAIRTRLQLLFRALEQRSIEHGVRRGRDLDERMFADTYTELRGGRSPERAFYEVEGLSVETSVAAIFVLDESSSMKEKGKRPKAAAAVEALGSALEQIGAKVMVVGFRNSSRSTGASPVAIALSGQETSGVHRTAPMRYDIFKTWEERWSAARARLTGWRAESGTPMADGIEFALNYISARKEGHRLVFVFTDGMPDHAHLPVIKGQLARAEDAGVQLVGVGMGSESAPVQGLFPDHVYAPEISDLPVPLVKRVEALVRTMPGSKRGRAVRSGL